jgi:hypothetical protein
VKVTRGVVLENHYVLEMAHRGITVLKLVLSMFTWEVGISTNEQRMRPLAMSDVVEIGFLAQV